MLRQQNITTYHRHSFIDKIEIAGRNEQRRRDGI